MWTAFHITALRCAIIKSKYIILWGETFYDQGVCVIKNFTGIKLILRFKISILTRKVRIAYVKIDPVFKIITIRSLILQWVGCKPPGTQTDCHIYQCCVTVALRKAEWRWELIVSWWYFTWRQKENKDLKGEEFPGWLIWEPLQIQNHWLLMKLLIKWRLLYERFHSGIAEQKIRKNDYFELNVCLFY